MTEKMKASLLVNKLFKSYWIINFARLNLSRYLRRTITAVVMIATAFASLALFSGYTMNSYSGMRKQAIFSEMLGHMTISKSGLLKKRVLDPENSFMSKQDIAIARKAVLKFDPKAKLFPRITFNGLISNGTTSTIFIAEALNPEDMRTLRGSLSYSSGMLEPTVENGITVSKSLADLLKAKEGSELSLLSSTIHDQTNVIGTVVTDTYDTGNIATNDKSIYISLKQARSLLDAHNLADRMTVLLKDETTIDKILPLIQNELHRTAGSTLMVNSWKDEALFYKQVKSMFDVIFAFVFFILSFICVMVINNVIGVSVIERAREIGSLRAQGMKQITVVYLFIVEAQLMILLGCLLGFAINLVIRHFINSFNIGYTPPNSTIHVPLSIGIDTIRLLQITVFLCLCGAAAAWWTTRRIARKPIIYLLGHT